MPIPHSPRRPGRSALSVLFVLLVICGATTAQAQTRVNAGAFIVEFWDRANGNAYAIDTTILQTDLGTWTAAERQTIIRSFEYWTNVLGLPDAPANAPVIRVIKDESQTFFNANALSVFTATPSSQFGGATLRKSNTYDRLVEGNNPARDMGIDGRLIFEPAGETLVTDPSTQLPSGDFALDWVSIHEIGHILGIDGFSQVHTQFLVGGNHIGPQTRAVFGGPMPYFPDGAHHVLEFHNLTRGLPFNESFRNIPYFSPAELANYADMGWFGLDLSQQFGTAFYQDGTGATETINIPFNSSADYAVGVFIQADNRNIIQSGDINISGFAGAGVRIANESVDPTGTTVTIAPSADIDVSGDDGVGVVVSSGVGNVIVHRGSITANGNRGTGMLFDFGPAFFETQLSSRNYRGFLVDRIDITGSITAENGAGNAIVIRDTSAIREINIMRGAVLNGNIVSDALVEDISAPGGTTISLTAPALTFGKRANGQGEATAAADTTFTFSYAGNISGAGKAALDLDFVGGRTTLGGTLNVQDATVRNSAAAVFAGAATLNDLRSLGGATTVASVGSLNADAVFLQAGQFISNGATAVGGTFDMDAGVLNVGSTGSLLASRFDLLSGNVGVAGLMDINNAYVMGGGRTTIVGGGNLLADTFAMNAGNVAVQGLGSLTASAFNMRNGQVDVAGLIDVNNVFTMDGGQTNVAPTGNLNADSFVLEAGRATVLGQMNVASLFDVQAGDVVVNGLVVADQFMIDSAALLQGSGVVRATTVQNDGTIAPGNSIGVLTIDGDYVGDSNSVLDVEIDPAGNSDLLIVTGTATIEGGSVIVSGPPGDYAIGSNYTFLEAGMLNVPVEPEVIVSIADRRVINFIDSQSFSLLVARDVPYASLARTPNQFAFGSYLDAVRLDPDIQIIRDTLDLIPTEDPVRFGFDQLTGEIYGSHLASRLQSTSMFLDMVANQTRSVGPCCPFYYDSEAVGAWYAGHGVTGRFDGNGNAREAEFSGAGAAFGLSRRFTPWWLGGAFYGFESLNTDVDDLAQRVESDVHRFGLYSEWRSEIGPYLRAAGLASYADSDSSRIVSIQSPILGIAERPTAGFGGSTGAGDIEIGDCFQRGPWSVQPFLGMRYLRVGQDSVEETGGGVTNLLVDDTAYESLRGRVGARLFGQMIQRLPSLNWSFEAIWQHQLFKDQEGGYTATLAAADSAEFIGQGVQLDRNWAVLSPGIVWQRDWLRLSGQYRTELNSRAVVHSGNAVLELLW